MVYVKAIAVIFAGFIVTVLAGVVYGSITGSRAPTNTSQALPDYQATRVARSIETTAAAKVAESMMYNRWARNVEQLEAWYEVHRPEIAACIDTYGLDWDYYSTVIESNAVSIRSKGEDMLDSRMDANTAREVNRLLDEALGYADSIQKQCPNISTSPRY